MFDLVFLTGARAGVTVPADGSAVAGREPECEIIVPDPQVSRAHATFNWDGQRFRLVDQRSSNGTYVNERPVQETELHDGDIVRMGNTRLRVVRRDPPSQVIAAASQTRTGRSASAGGAQRASSLFGVVEGASTSPHWTHSLSVDDLVAGRTAARTVDRDVEAEVRGLRHRLASMIRVAGDLARADSVEGLFEVALDALFELLPQTDRAFLLLGASAAELTPAAVRDRTDPRRRQKDELRVSRSICAAALSRREAVMYHEGGEQAFDAGNSIVDLQIRSAIAAPLLVGADVLGVVVLDTRHLRRAYDQDDLELVVSICHQIAVAIRNRQLLEQVEKQTRTRDNLRRFLPKPMADQVLAGEIDAGLGGKKYRGTVMFADVVGFTARSERTEPSELVRSMNVYFERVAPCVLAEGGSIDKFMGDAIMAVWGIPVALEDGGVRAVAAALRMQTRVAGLNATLDDPFGLGIGIHAGELVAGNIGTEERKEYTVLGDTVNTAQRLETIACVEQVIVSEVAWNDCRGKLFGIRMPPAELRNKSEPVVSFSVRGLVQSEAGEVELFLPIEVMDEEGVSRGHLIRRLADGTFLALLPRLDGVRPGSRVTSAAAEWSGVALATVESVAAAPPEAEDGGLIRCRLELSSPDLAGLLGEEALVALAATDSRLDRSDSLARWMAP